jgi:hypothetical protein
MITNKTNTKKLGYNSTYTIDWKKYINCINLKAKMLEDEGYIYAPKKRYDVIYTYFFLYWIIAFIISLFIAFWYFIPTEAEASNSYVVDEIVIPKFLYDNLLIECTNEEHSLTNYHHCIKTWLAIAYAESTFNNQNNYFWLMSKDKSIKSWVTRYVKYWYTAKEWSFFYWKNGISGESRYCMSEESSWSVGWCPNWLRNFNYIFMNQSLDLFIKKWVEKTL